MDIKVTMDLPRFQASLRNKMKATKKTEAEVVNHASKNIAYRAASFTPKATPADVKQGLRRDDILRKLAIRALRKELGTGKGAWGTKAEAKAKLAEKMKKILAARLRGIGALRAGWIPAVLALGGSYRGAVLRPGGTASKGTATKATIENLSSIIRNTAMTRNHAGQQFSADQIAIATNALHRAVEFVTDDMEGYIARKINQTLVANSD